MGVQRMFPFTHWRSHALTSVYDVFSTHSKVFMCTHKHSGGVQYWLKGIYAHSQAFRECSVLTQMRILSWSHRGELHSIMTQWRSCALIGCPHSLNGIHTHSMGAQGLFPLTHWRSRALTSIQGVFNTCSAWSCIWRPNEYVFKIAKHAQALKTFSQFSFNEKSEK